jgi:16S rRNA (cytosine1402-N4)-methyltransferase
MRAADAVMTDAEDASGTADPPFHHRPVMVDEIVAAFATVPPGFVLDATLGGGGHSEALLLSRPDLGVVGIDRDPEAIAAAEDRLAPFAGRFATARGSFEDLDQILDDLEPPVEHLSGALFDLGVSSPQFDRGRRGFSYRLDGPLDMRMDPAQSLSAADVINGYAVDDLTRVIRRYGDERFAARIARAIAAARPILSTGQLAEIVRSAIPAATRRRGGHPARRTFQAIRVEVNAELEVLPVALGAAIDRIVAAGRIAVLSYHSGEDRIVKDRFRRAAGVCDCPPALPCVCGARHRLRLVRGIARKPADAELAENPRAASARLRVAERIDDAGRDDVEVR